MEIIFTVIGLVSFGFIAGFIFCSLLISGERADINFHEAIIMDLHHQLEEANETIYALSREKDKLLELK